MLGVSAVMRFVVIVVVVVIVIADVVVVLIAWGLMSQWPTGLVTWKNAGRVRTSQVEDTKLT